MSSFAHRGEGLRRFACAVPLLIALGGLTAFDRTAAHAQGSGWTGTNIGGATPGGMATYGGGIFTVEGGGARIYSTSDQFFFLHYQATGDVTVTARVLAVENTNPWAKVGVMIRESLASNSKHAAALVTPMEGGTFDRRTLTAGTTSQTRATGLVAPVWLRLVRTGSTITASRSSSGTSWTTIGSTTVSMAATVHVGLAVASYNSAALATAAFSSVSMTGMSATGPIVPISVAPPTSPTAPTSNAPPTVTLTAPASGSTFHAPAVITLAANAADSDGGVSRVDFYVGSTLVGSDASSPYQVGWSAVQGGSYSLKAVARDNLGAATSSAARSITVVAPRMPTRAVFVASPDHAIVTRYILDIFVAGSGSLGPPIATRDLGKPPVVNGECSVDIASTINGLPGGSYIATVVAVSSSGKSARAISAVFAR